MGDISSLVIEENAISAEICAELGPAILYTIIHGIEQDTQVQGGIRNAKPPYRRRSSDLL